MAILRALDHFFGSLELAQRYARLFALGDADLAARGLTRDELGRRYLDDLAALDAATKAPRTAKGRLHAPA
jgi:hypothetical protein